MPNICKENEMNAKYVKSLVVVMLLAALAGCATGGAGNSPAYPTDTTGEAEG
jgi:type IV pilus biogenesis protein CpaD/CtpE